MKIKFLSLFTMAVLFTALVSCKNEAKNETEAADAEAAAEVSTEAAKYMVDKNESEIAWEGEKPTGTHTGTVKLESGVIRLEDSVLSGSFLIDMTSILVTDLEGDQKTSLEDHLKGTVEGKEGDFFNVQKYPTAAFEITGVTEKDGKKMMSGNLTLKETKKNIEFPVMYEVAGNTMTLKSEPFTIDRTEWGVNYGSKSVFDNLGDKFINDDIQLEFTIVASQQM
ncbi:MULTISPECIES: YceI family protein [unclassified Leeuwenhoekiella]|uniref:YceI family protein n=1 Tax=unclassified Leeuwenhoekiella TaxID=2615029 RepID=UPI000C460A15|nr:MULTISPECIES: YceI family protein [unclassified Leeuwenhoekiella]MAW96685.1 lipid-binding protein [Leeuwenhoekiella sp.]MBA81574.1 lipid-binding protein [Leeuwenhoekiella sp.]|tara:strand:+ start:77165 stop:77836 length:672 start_codon:yes stop_codon:yes gene_type:complete